MDRLVDHLFVFEGEGIIRDFPGNYSQYRGEIRAAEDTDQKTVKAVKDSKRIEASEPAVGVPSRKLSFKEKGEFEILEKEISLLEKEKQLVTEKLNSGAIPFDELQILSKRIGEITEELDTKELRWLELSEAAQ